jgi:ribosomal protein L37AE/L43A
MNPIEQTQHRCPLCHHELDRKGIVWICFHCLIIWHGDTFEPVSLETLGRAALDDLFS